MFLVGVLWVEGRDVPVKLFYKVSEPLKENTKMSNGKLGER